MDQWRFLSGLPSNKKEAVGGEKSRREELAVSEKKKKEMGDGFLS